MSLTITHALFHAVLFVSPFLCVHILGFNFHLIPFLLEGLLSVRGDNLIRGGGEGSVWPSGSQSTCLCCHQPSDDPAP